MAVRKCIPYRLEFVNRMPLSPACAFADASKRGYRTKAKPSNSIKKDTDTPGSRTSTDHTISHEPGLIPQVTGRLTHKRYAGAVVYSDHYSDYTYRPLWRKLCWQSMHMNVLLKLMG